MRLTWNHGELLKLGIKVSQATVGRWMPWRPKVPSPTWRSFLQNHLPDIAAIDMFVVATATFRLLYALIVLSLDRRRIVHFEVAPNPTQDWLSRQMTEAFAWDTAPRYLLREPSPVCGIWRRRSIFEPKRQRFILFFVNGGKRWSIATSGGAMSIDLAWVSMSNPYLP
jgi:hypothetical protein